MIVCASCQRLETLPTCHPRHHVTAMLASVSHGGALRDSETNRATAVGVGRGSLPPSPPCRAFVIRLFPAGAWQLIRGGPGLGGPAFVTTRAPRGRQRRRISFVRHLSWKVLNKVSEMVSSGTKPCQRVLAFKIRVQVPPRSASSATHHATHLVHVSPPVFQVPARALQVPHVMLQIQFKRHPTCFKCHLSTLQAQRRVLHI